MLTLVNDSFDSSEACLGELVDLLVDKSGLIVQRRNLTAWSEHTTTHAAAATFLLSRHIDILFFFSCCIGLL